MNNTIVTTVTQCVDSDNGATNQQGEGCTMYSDTPDYCGFFGDSDFNSGTMCCSCGGGIIWIDKMMSIC